LKFGIYVHSKRPKISPNKILKVVESSGLSYSNRDPDMAIVVGGDGTFGYYGKKLHIPMLFVGVNDNDVLGSKARLAELLFDDLHKALSEIKKGNYRLEKRTMFCVCIKQKNNDNKKEGRIERATDILTDMYIERGIFSRCIRYALSVTMRKPNSGYHTLKKFAEYAIGNGVIVSTSFGAYGYYSYLDRITVGKRNNNKSNNGAQFSDNKLGICHIIPTFLVRKLSLGYKKETLVRSSHIRYTVPNQSIIKISLTRNADVRLYGTTENSRGMAITSDDEILIRRSRHTAKIIRLDFDRTTR
jgi:NAD kinase